MWVRIIKSIQILIRYCCHQAIYLLIGWLNSTTVINVFLVQVLWTECVLQFWSPHFFLVVGAHLSFAACKWMCLKLCTFIIHISSFDICKLLKLYWSGSLPPDLKSMKCYASNIEAWTQCIVWVFPCVNPFQSNDAVRRHGHTRSFFHRLIHVSGIVWTSCVSNCIHNTHRKPISRS